MPIAFDNESNFIAVASGNNYLGQGGNDTYFLSDSLIASDSSTVISDSGSNTVQLSGLSIASSTVTSNAVELTLENGATVQVLGADELTFEVGGNASAGVEGTQKDFQTFVEEDLGTQVPAEGENAGGAVSIPEATDGGGTGFTLTESANAVEEGQDLSFTVETADGEAVSEDTSFDYDLSGSDIEAADLSSGSLTGSGTIAAGESQAQFSIGLANDETTEGAENVEATVNVGGETHTADAVVDDTSQDPEPAQADFTLTEGLQAQSVAPDGTVTYEATVRNDGDAETTGDVSLTVADQDAASESVTLASGATQDLTFDVDVSSSGLDLGTADSPYEAVLDAGSDKSIADLTVTDNQAPTIDSAPESFDTQVGAETRIPEIDFSDADDNVGFEVTVSASDGSQLYVSDAANNVQSTVRDANGNTVDVDQTEPSLVLSGTETAINNDLEDNLMHVTNASDVRTEQLSVEVADQADNTVSETIEVAVANPIEFTSNQDTLSGTAGDDIFEEQTQGDFEAQDSADGGDGTDTIRLNGVTNFPSGATLSSIEVAEIDTAGGSQSITLDNDTFNGDLETVNFTEAGDDTPSDPSDSSERDDTLIIDNAGDGFTAEVDGGVAHLELGLSSGSSATAELQGGIWATNVRSSGDANLTDLTVVSNSKNGAEANNNGFVNVIGNLDTSAGNAGNGNGNVQTVTVTGDSALQVRNVSSALEEVDAGEHSGGVTMDLTNSGQSVSAVGGSGDDDFSVADGSSHTLVGNEGDDTLRGADQADTIEGGDGNDTITGAEGDDSLSGGAGADSIDGGDGDDTITAGPGDDTVSGGAGNDSITGGAGADSLSGNGGDDTIAGGDGNDTITGGAGTDSLSGGAGDDSIDGGEGNDTIDGGVGADTLTGGGGDDTYIVEQGDTGSSSGERDTITDLTRGDVLDVSDYGDFGLTDGESLNKASSGQDDSQQEVYIDPDNQRLVMETAADGSETEEINIGDAAERDFTFDGANNAINVGTAPFTTSNNESGKLTTSGDAVGSTTTTVTNGAPLVNGSQVGTNAVTVVDSTQQSGGVNDLALNVSNDTITFEAYKATQLDGDTLTLSEDDSSSSVASNPVYGPSSGIDISNVENLVFDDTSANATTVVLDGSSEGISNTSIDLESGGSGDSETDTVTVVLENSEDIALNNQFSNNHFGDRQWVKSGTGQNSMEATSIDDVFEFAAGDSTDGSEDSIGGDNFGSTGTDRLVFTGEGLENDNSDLDLSGSVSTDGSGFLDGSNGGGFSDSEFDIELKGISTETDVSGDIVLGTSDDAFVGGSGGNAITGHDGQADHIDGAGGDDTLNGKGGDDTLVGGAGNDTLNGGGGADTLTGGSAADTFVFDSGDSTDGSEDEITDLQDTDDSGSIDDVIALTGNASTAIDLSSSQSTSSGDLAFGANHDITVTFDSAGTDNSIELKDNIQLGTSNNALVDTNSSGETFNGSDTFGDNIEAGGGNSGDTLNGRGGNDTLTAQSGASDSLSGGAGADTLVGSSAGDTLVGGDGNDTIEIAAGNSSADTLDFSAVASNGTDTISGFAATGGSSDTANVKAADTTASSAGAGTTNTTAASSGSTTFDTSTNDVLGITTEAGSTIDANSDGSVVLETIDSDNDTADGGELAVKSDGEQGFVIVEDGNNTGLFHVNDTGDSDTGDIQTDEIELVGLFDDFSSASNLIDDITLV